MIKYGIVFCSKIMKFCIATLSHDAQYRAEYLERTISSFTDANPDFEGDWYIFLNSYNDELLEECLQRAGLWSEVKDRLNEHASALSGGQQQRLCIARSLAVRPEVLLMDEPCSALDPGSTFRIEETISHLAKTMTIVIVTHNMQQAARVSDYSAFLLSDGGPGELIESAPTSELFSRPRDKRTEDYVTGRFG